MHLLTSTSGPRSGGLGRPLSDVLEANESTGADDAPSPLFGVVGDDVESRLGQALDALAEAFPDDVAVARHRPSGLGAVLRVRSRHTLAPDTAFRLGGLLLCSGDELVVVYLPLLGDDVALAVWRPSGAFGPADRRRVEVIAAVATH